jgi:hypothetical protein
VINSMTYAELTNHIAHIVLTSLILVHVYIAWLIYQAYKITKVRSRKRGK